MRRTLTLLMVALLLVTSTMVAAGPSAAADQPNAAIRLSGERTAYTDVTIDRPTTLDRVTSRFDYEGEFAGWVAHPVGRSFGDADMVGAYVKDGVGYDSDGRRVVMPIGGNIKGELAPGTYRFYLLADGPAEITIPIVTGISSMALEPVRHVRARLHEVAVPVAGHAVVAGTTRIPITVTPDRLTVNSLTLFSDPAVAVGHTSSCVRRLGTATPICEDTADQSLVQCAAQSCYTTISTSYGPGTLEAGQHEAFHSATMTLVHQVVALVLQVDLQRA